MTREAIRWTGSRTHRLVTAVFFALAVILPARAAWAQG